MTYPTNEDQEISSPECAHCKSRNASLFHFCHMNEVETISESKTCSSYKRGQIIFQEGSRPTGMFCINKGRIKVYKIASDGKQQIVRIAQPGDFLGYSSMLSGSNYTVASSAMEDSIVCYIPKSEIRALFKTSEPFSDAFVGLLSKTIDDTVHKMAEIAYKPVRGRIAEALLILHAAAKCEENPNGTITITREDLASFVGTVKETCIRVLKDLKINNLITTDRSEIIIQDLSGLVKISQLYD